MYHMSYHRCYEPEKKLMHLKDLMYRRSNYSKFPHEPGIFHANVMQGLVFNSAQYGGLALLQSVMLGLSSILQESWQKI